LENQIPKDFPNQNLNPYEIGECIQRCQMVVIHATHYKTIPMTHVFGTFFAKYLFIFEDKVWQFEI
jgi:hypothetical protein